MAFASSTLTSAAGSEPAEIVITSDGVSDLADTINDALHSAECLEGRPVLLQPPGPFMISEPIELLQRNVLLSYSGYTWGNDHPQIAQLAPTAGFVGDYYVGIRGQAYSGDSVASRGGILRGVHIDGDSGAGSGRDGILLKGSVKGWAVEEIYVRDVSGNGVSIDAVDGSHATDVQTNLFRRIQAGGCGGHGVYLNYGADNVFREIHVAENGDCGMSIYGANSVFLDHLHAEWNTNFGLYLGGGLVGIWSRFSNLMTDRNGKSGLYIDAVEDATWKGAFQFSDLFLRRDGTQGTGNAALSIGENGSASGNTPRCFVSNLVTVVHGDDASAPPVTPESGIRVGAKCGGLIVNGGEIWGESAAIVNSDETLLRLGKSVSLVSGAPGAESVSWVTATNGAGTGRYTVD